MPFGAELRADGTVRFRLWAPAAEVVRLELPGRQASFTMRRLERGWHEVVTPAAAGDAYQFVLPDGVQVADPASRCQARDAVGPSLVIDPSAYHWQHQDWRGRPWREAVVYELHIGSFTPGGTFAGAIERLPYLSQLGVTAIELMPLADFPGRRNWGYDGVLPFAPDRSYGTPDELKALVDAAHGHGLMVFLDVVYNHFGPAGNSLGRYAPEFFTADFRTPWGEAIDFRRPEVRAFYIANALYWLEEFRFDGLRLDAVHAIVDPSETHFLVELARTVRTAIGRDVHLVLENDHNRASFLRHAPELGRRLFDAQWNDDLHHAMHVLLTGERHGYYADFADAPVERLRRALTEGFVYQGEPAAYGGGRPRGEPSGDLPPLAFVELSPEPRPDRQSCPRRAAVAARRARGRPGLPGDLAAQPAGAAAVHGRGMGGAVPHSSTLPTSRAISPRQSGMGAGASSRPSSTRSRRSRIRSTRQPSSGRAWTGRSSTTRSMRLVWPGLDASSGCAPSKSPHALATTCEWCTPRRWDRAGFW